MVGIPLLQSIIYHYQLYIIDAGLYLIYFAFSYCALLIVDYLPCILIVRSLSNYTERSINVEAPLEMPKEFIDVNNLNVQHRDFSGPTTLKETAFKTHISKDPCVQATDFQISA